MATRPKKKKGNTLEPVPDVLNDENERKLSIEPVKKHEYKAKADVTGQRKNMKRRVQRRGTPIVRKRYDWATSDDFKIKSEANEVSGVEAYLQFNRIPTEQRNGVWVVREDTLEGMELLEAERALLEDVDESTELASPSSGSELGSANNATTSRRKLVPIEMERQETIRSPKRSPSAEVDDQDPNLPARTKSSLVLKVQKNEEDTPAKKFIRRITQHIAFTVVMIILTIWALFGTDLGLVFVKRKDEIILGSVMFGVMIAFIIEMCLLSYIHPKTYFLGFFFWMDLIAIISLVPDILVVFGVNFTTDASAFTLARVGRIARAAVRTARLVRLVKVFELFFLWLERRKRQGDRLNWMDVDEEDEEKVPDSVVTHDTKRINNNMERMVETSVLGEALLDSMFKKVFTMILVFAIVLSFLDPNVVFDKTIERSEVSLKQTYDVCKNLGQTDPRCTAQVGFMQENDLMYLNLEGVVKLNRILDRRKSEVFEIDIGCGAGECIAIYDMRDESIAAAARSIYFTLFTIFILVVGSGAIHGTLRDLVVKPIERMVGVVKLLALKPLATLQLKEDFAFETGLVESMILKMGRLLQIGFGVAGAHIITSNLSSSGALVPIAPGRRVQAVFLFVKVNGFFEITDALQEDVLIFLNRVAQLVHAIAGQYGGFPYESSGLGTTSLVFLLPYRKNSKSDQEFKDAVKKVHESAMRAAREIHMASQSAQFTRFMVKVPKISTLSLSFGLHTGWSIAGPVGSNLKVDASYVSPYVHEAALLMEHTTKYYFNLLMSGDFREGLSKKTKDTTTLVDKCLLLGAVHPLDVYTTDERLIDDKTLKLTDKLKLKTVYSTGVESYIKGDWNEAAKHIKKAIELYPAFESGRMLLAFMERPPSNWDGIRVWEED